MSETALQIPGWGAWFLRAAIYAGFALLLYWWHPVLGVGAGVFVAVDLIHHAADTARRRCGYRPIPRHPSNPETPQAKLEIRGRPLAILFAMVWASAAVIGRAVMDVTWPEALMQSFALAAFVAVLGALLFRFAVIALLWVLSVTIGLVLSIGDLAGILLASPEQRKAWHRAVDQTDHSLADLVLGQSAAIPLRADLALRAAEEAIGKK